MDHFGRYVRQFTSLPSFHLLSHRFEVSLHSINTHRYAIHERERLRVFGQDRRKHARDNVSKLTWSRTMGFESYFNSKTLLPAHSVPEASATSVACSPVMRSRT